MSHDQNCDFSLKINVHILFTFYNNLFFNYASSLYACAFQMACIVYVTGVHVAIESIAANRYA
jgi:hypothetical protein